ncbi:hypothetical protein [Catenulispora pinisilvae]|uniref:hypothetical protein n=1 Tax=Catenulispora pinisilvae TaxID=2705253 RepID=UPI0018919FC7|nr:hypothetical protein [Catenulispora pinisilvae]
MATVAQRMNSDSEVFSDQIPDDSRTLRVGFSPTDRRYWINANTVWCLITEDGTSEWSQMRIPAEAMDKLGHDVGYAAEMQCSAIHGNTMTRILWPV